MRVRQIKTVTFSVHSVEISKFICNLHRPYVVILTISEAMNLDFGKSQPLKVAKINTSEGVKMSKNIYLNLS